MAAASHLFFFNEAVKPFPRREALGRKEATVPDPKDQAQAQRLAVCWGRYVAGGFCGVFERVFCLFLQVFGFNLCFQGAYLSVFWVFMALWGAWCRLRFWSFEWVLLVVGSDFFASKKTEKLHPADKKPMFPKGEQPLEIVLWLSDWPCKKIRSPFNLPPRGAQRGSTIF